MANLEFLKKLVIIAEKMQSFGELDFKDAPIEVNVDLDRNDKLRYAFDVLEIPFIFKTYSSGFVLKEPSVFFPISKKGTK